MSGDRLLHILSRLEPGANADRLPARICEVSVEITAVTGAGMMLMSRDVPHEGGWSSDGVGARIEALQYTLGEGPSIDAFDQDRPMVEIDLANPSALRWVAFSPLAVDAGAQAVFAFPLHVGAIRLGALTLYRDSPGPLDDEGYANGLVLAGLAARTILAMQTGVAPGTLGAELEAGLDLRIAVHQAAGMVSAQLDVSVAVALLRLRSSAFANDRPLLDVAQDVLERRLRFA